MIYRLPTKSAHDSPSYYNIASLFVEPLYKSGKTTPKADCHTIVMPKPNSVTNSYIKINVMQKSIPPHPNALPQTTPMNTSNRFGTPTTLLLTELPNSWLNFVATARLHKRVYSTQNHQIHFPNKSWLKVVSSLIPSPSLTIFKWCLNSSPKPPPQELLCHFSILFATLVEIVNKKKHYVGKLKRVLFSNVNWPPLYNLFQPVKPCSNFSKIQVPNQLRLKRSPQGHTMS